MTNNKIHSKAQEMNLLLGAQNFICQKNHIFPALTDKIIETKNEKMNLFVRVKRQQIKVSIAHDQFIQTIFNLA